MKATVYSTVDEGFMEDESYIVWLMEGSWRMKANIVRLMAFILHESSINRTIWSFMEDETILYLLSS